MEESLADGATHCLFGPVRMRGAEGSCFELPRRVVEPLRGLQLLGRRHGPQDAQ